MSRAGAALVGAIGRLVSRAVDENLLGDQRVTSAAEGRRLLAGDGQTESLVEDIQRVIVLAVPVLRALAHRARFVKLPWVIVGSTAISVGVVVRTGVREIQMLSSLVAHRLEQATGAPANPALVKKVALRPLPPSETQAPSNGRQAPSPANAQMGAGRDLRAQTAKRATVGPTSDLRPSGGKGA